MQFIINSNGLCNPTRPGLLLSVLLFHICHSALRQEGSRSQWLNSGEFPLMMSLCCFPPRSPAESLTQPWTPAHLWRWILWAPRVSSAMWRRKTFWPSKLIWTNTERWTPGVKWVGEEILITIYVILCLFIPCIDLFSGFDTCVHCHWDIALYK